MKHISDIKHKNKKDIIQLLYKKTNMSKKRIALELELSASVITKLCNELIEEGIILETEPLKTKHAGRKEIEIQINPLYKKSIGITMNHKKTTILLTNMNMDILHQISFSTNLDAKTHLDKLIDSLREIIDHFGLPNDTFLGIGVSIKGNTDGINANFGIWEGKVNITGYLQKQLGIPTVMDNGIRCSAMLEQLKCDEQNFIFIKYMEPGIGGAIVQDGMIKLGESHSILDFGHLIVTSGDTYCNICKRKGCLENTISYDHMIYDIKSNFSYEFSPLLFNLCNGDPEAVNITTLIAAAEAGCIKTNELFKRNATYFAICIINTYALLDIKKIIIIGELFSSNRFITYLKTAIYDYQLTPIFESIEFHIHENELLSPVVLALNHFLFK